MTSLLIKPVGDRCNFNCAYCFYHPNSLTPSKSIMPAEVLEATIRNFIRAPGPPVKRFGWQGGEPTLAGLDFFHKVVKLQEKYKSPEQTVQNAFQTNGMVVDEKWADFFAKNDFLVGLSLDGPPEIHNANRITRSEDRSYKSVRRAWDLMNSRGVAVNILSVVSAANWDRAEAVYKHIYDELGAEYAQFIPCVEWAGKHGEVHPFSVLPGQYGSFLCDLFDLWKREKTRSVSVKLFDDLILNLAGKPMGDCMHAPNCGSHFLIDWNGDVYPCDFFVVKRWRFGNILKKDFTEFERMPTVRTFRKQKRRDRSRECKKCPQLDLCRGGCPKFWIYEPPKGRNKNYLCPDMKLFFGEKRAELEEMAKVVRARMEQLRRQPSGGC